MKRILYIEDNAFTQRVVKERLSAVGEVMVASRLVEGRRLLEEQPFDLLLSDVFLPDGSALDLVHEQRTRRSPQQLPVILISSAMDQLLRTQCFGVGANECFRMPTPWPILMEGVARMLAHPYIAAGSLESVAPTVVQGKIEGRFWVFCPELNLFLTGDNLEALRDMVAERVRAAVGGTGGLPYVSHVSASAQVVRRARPLGPGGK